MRNIYFYCLIFLFANLSINQSFAYDCYIGGVYYELSGEEAYVVSHTNNSIKYAGNINIPNTIDYSGKKYLVTKIKDFAFSGCPNLNSVIIPNSVTSIGDYAFFNSGLKSITMPNSVYDVGKRILNSTPWLTGQPDGLVYVGQVALTYKGDIIANPVLKEGTIGIASEAFLNKRSMGRITIPKTLKHIGESAFQGCADLTGIQISDLSAWCQISYSGNPIIKDHDIYVDGRAITNLAIPENCFKVGDYAFYNCNNIKSVQFHNNIKSIGDYTFFGCISLTTLDIPIGVSSIGNSAFSHCKKLTNLNIPNGLTILGERAFENCESLKEIILSDLIETIGFRTFYGCASLRNIKLGSNIKSIGQASFTDCRSLTSIKIPKSVNTIRTSCFNGCWGLKAVYIEDLTTWCKTQVDSNPLDYAHHLFLNKTEITHLVIPTEVDSIKNNVFSGCDALVSVELHDRLKYIGYNSFQNCTGITHIRIPNSVVDCGKAFNGCTNLRLVELSMQNIGQSFSELKSIEELILTDEVRTIEDNAFQYCLSLKSICIPNHILSIGRNAFPANTSVFVEEGSVSLLSLWNSNYTPYSIESKEKLIAPSPVLIKVSQTAFILKLDIPYKNYQYSLNSQQWYNEKDSISITKLYPDETYRYLFIVKKDSTNYSKYVQFKTNSLELKINLLKKSASSIEIEGTYLKEDAIIDTQYFVCGNKTIEGDRIKVVGLDPNSTTNVFFYVDVKSDYSGGYARSYNCDERIQTLPLTLTTLSPKVTNKGEAVVCATTNMDDAETNAGFEWRKTDAPDVVESRQGEAVIYNGKMEGKIKNLDASSYWKVRAYYKSNSGNMYYGDWIGFDPSDFSYFEPTVHTYGSPVVSGTSVTLAGAAVEGSDEILEQGFEYWKGSASTRGMNRVPSNVQRVTATGQRMIATLTGLAAGTQYGYRAFVKTAKGTFYGEEQTFTTEGSSSGEEGNPEEGTTGTPYTITTAAAGYATFYDSKSAYALPSELTAQVVTGFANNKLVFETIGSTVPKGVAVMLTSTNKRAASYTLNPTASSATYAGTNLLHGNDAATTTAGNGYHYKLSYGKSGSLQSNVFGWYWGAQNGGSFQIDGHKAWLVLPTSANTRSFTIDGESTGITLVENGGGDEAAYYDLQGRRISRPTTKGVYIVNGKKVTIK